MECPSCGGQSTDTARCTECGMTLGPPVCAVCGRANSELANYCSECGQPLRLSSPPPPSDAPAQLREELALRARTAVEGELRQVTVLFADVRDSFQVIQDADPEEVAALLDSVLQVMIAAVHRYEGVVNQVLGDGLMALFGAPVAQEDHAVRASCAALAMQKAVTAMHHPSWEARQVTPQIRIGLNSGDVIFRAVRTDLSIDYRAVGSTIHMAARMEQLAAAGTILLTAQTKRLAGRWLKTRALGSREIKGLSEPIEVFELLGTQLRTRFQAAELRELSTLTGRSELLCELERLMAAALAGAPQTIVLSGEPGVGKSRLCYEVLQVGVARGARVLEASAPSHGRGTPHGMLANLARALFGVDDSDAPEVVAGKARSALTDCSVSADERAAFALEVFELSKADSPWQKLDPVERRRRIERMLLQLIECWCARGPAILVFEDVHWCDSESLAFLRALLPEPPGRELLIMFTHRSDHQIAWPDLAHIHLRQLTSLPSDAAEALITALIGAGSDLGPVRKLLVERAGGNPFFLEESAQSLVDSGVLIGELQNYQLRGEFEQLRLPQTIDALISARVDRLPLASLHALEALAVTGDETPANLLCHVLNLPPSVLEERLWLLLQAELVFRVNEGGPVYRLKHSLIRDVVYRRLVRARKKALHSRVMRAIEQVYRVRVGEHVEQLAEHATRAELWEKSIAYHQMACMRALRRWANSQALAHIETSLGMVAQLPEGDARDRVALDLRLLALAPLVPVGDHERMVQLLLEAEQFARKLNDPKRLAAVQSQLTLGFWMLGHHERALACAYSVQAYAATIQEPSGLPDTARHNLAMILHARGELAQALPMLRALAQRFSGESAGKQLRGWAGYPGVYVRTFLISTLSQTGGFAEARRAFEEGRAVAEAQSHSHSRAMIMEEYGFCLWVQGEYAASRELLTATLEICERDEVTVMRAPTVARLGVALIETGELEAGLALLQGDLDRETYKQAAHYGHVYLLIGLSEARRRVGLRAGLAAGAADVSMAIALAEQAEAVTREAGEQAYRVCALLQLAAALQADPQRSADALARYEEALSETRRLGMRPWEALAWSGLATHPTYVQDAARAQRALETALDLWTTLGAPRRCEDVRARLSQLRA